jgi:protein transport protein SEC31
MKVGQIDKNATVAWSKSSPLLALGTLAGTMSESFDTSGTLEIYDLSRGPENVEHKVSVDTEEKFFKLIWSQASGNTARNPLGLIAGGMESGVINLWSPTLLLQYAIPVLAASFSDSRGVTLRSKASCTAPNCTLDRSRASTSTHCRPTASHPAAPTAR